MSAEDNKGTYQDTRALLNAVLAQVSAESILDGTIGNRDLMSVRLVNGPNHFWNFPGVYSQPSDGQHSATQSTDLMLDDFFDTWTVLHQLPNTTSGFAATVLFNKKTETITLSFRSTESLPKSSGGDFERDGGDGADGEITFKGFAFGQLLDMEKYYAELKAGTGTWLEDLSESERLAIKTNINNPDKPISVTGYSLGSHLAQVFTILHSDKVVNTTTFNGAGFGGLGVCWTSSSGKIISAFRISLV